MRPSPTCKTLLFGILITLLLGFTTTRVYGQNGGSIACDTTVSGYLAPEDIHEWRFDPGGNNFLITIRLEASTGGLDPYLEIWNEFGFINANDDYGGELNSRLDLPAIGSGAYRILAAPLGQGSEGEYALTMTCNPFQPQPLNFNQPISATISDSAPLYLYAFSGNAGDTISVGMAATATSDVDSMVFVYTATGALLAANDDYENLDALAVATLSETGVYYVVFTRFGSSYGDFTGLLEGEGIIIETPAAIEEPALVTVEELLRSLDTALETGESGYVEGSEVEVRGVFGFFFVPPAYEEIEVAVWGDGDELVNVSYREFADPDAAATYNAGYPYYLYAESLYAARSGFGEGTHLALETSEALNPWDYGGSVVAARGTLTRDTSRGPGYVVYVLRLSDIRVIEEAQSPAGYLRAPGRVALPANAPGRQHTANNDCQYAVILGAMPQWRLIRRAGNPAILTDPVWHDIVFAYRTLRAMGVPAANIQVAYELGVVPAGMYGANFVTVTQNGTQAGITAAVNGAVNPLRQRTQVNNEQCTLYVVATGHGGGLISPGERIQTLTGAPVIIGGVLYVYTANGVYWWAQENGFLLDGGAGDPAADETDAINEAAIPIR